MGKVSAPYRSILGGVSRQPAERRRESQAWEMTNMVADAREGLIRRNGAQWLDAKLSQIMADTAAPGWRTLALDAPGTGSWSPIEVAYRTNGAEELAQGEVIPVDKTTGAILPVQAVGDYVDNIPTFRTAVAVGRFGLFAPTYDAGTDRIVETNDWATEDNQKRHLIWVRGGAYSRKFRIALIRGNQKFWVEWTTMQASYPLTLDTSDIPSNDPDYTKKVNDRTNEYNSAVNDWIGRSIADVQPGNIANNLAAELLASGFLGPDGTVEVIGTNICITDPSVEDVEADDSGDSTLIRAVGNTIGAATLLTTYGYPGKIVRVRPTSTSEGFMFYMKAVAKDGSTGKFTQVTWAEVSGTSTTVPVSPLWFGTVEDGVFYLTDNPATMRSIAGEFPDWIGRLAGDGESSPTPRFFRENIDCLFMFQDRLGIACGPTIALSRPGDYLNFWRGSILTVVAADPIEFQIIGGENDVIRQALYYDRNVVLFGDEKQYLLNGREAMTPATAAGVVMAQFKNASSVQPVLIGNLMFYATTGGEDVAPGIHQFQPGPITESPESNEVTQHVRPYFPGEVLNLIADTQNKLLFVRVDGAPYSLFLYQYTDNSAGTERLQDAWHRWDFPEHYGPLVAAAPSARGLLLWFGQAGTIAASAAPVTQWVSARVKLNAPGGPLLDFYRDAGTEFNGVVGFPAVATQAGVGYVEGNATLPGGDGWWDTLDIGNWAGDVTPEPTSLARVNSETLEGSILEDAPQAPATNVVVGDVFDSCWTPTSPWVRDGQGLAVTDGRLTVVSERLSLKNTGGIKLTVHETNQVCWERELWVAEPEAPAPTPGAQLSWSAPGSAWPGMDPFEALAPGTDTYPSTIPLVDAEYSAPTSGTPVTRWVGAKTELFGPDRGVTITVLDDFRLDELYIVVKPVQTNETWPENGTEQTSPAHWSVYLRGTGGVYLTDGTANLAGHTLLHATPPLATGDVIGVFNDLNQSGDGEFSINGTTYSYSGVGNTEVVMLQYGVNGAVYVPEEPEPEEPTTGLPARDPGTCAEDGCGREFRNVQVSWSQTLKDEDGEYTFPETRLQPVENVTVTVPIGRETRDFRLTLGSVLWAPLTISSVEWTGQYFNNTRRIG